MQIPNGDIYLNPLLNPNPISNVKTQVMLAFNGDVEGYHLDKMYKQ